MPPRVQFAEAMPSGPFVVFAMNVTTVPGPIQGTPQSMTAVFVTAPLEGTIGTGHPGAVTVSGGTLMLPPVPVKVTWRSLTVIPVVFTTQTTTESAARASDETRSREIATATFKQIQCGVKDLAVFRRIIRDSSLLPSSGQFGFSP